MSTEKVLCKHVGSRGKSEGVACRNRANPNFGDFCAKHKKVKRATIQSDEVFGSGEKAAEPAEKVTPKHKHSVWLLTLNSQKDIAKMSAEQKQEFKDLGDFIFSEENIAKYLIDRNSPDDPTKNIVKLAIEHTFEFGASKGRVHMHGILNLTHTGHYSVNQAAIRQLAEKVLGYKVHFNAKGSADQDAAMRAYIQKQQGDNAAEL
eukprot:TRINITY_DN358_c1_g2_i5.p2 TRINITY_DN358_c1_g2~~TRINITY_DN358_c1_g2_i5.p2  ORF type:complete len:205 (+),score=28.35 TRINITY_DN358_c1_g2_i5:1103-1717(+)